jgi:hypothetical protein
MVGDGQENRAGGTRESRLEEDFYGIENGRGKELFRRNGPGHDEGQRSLSSQIAGLTAPLVVFFRGMSGLQIQFSLLIGNWTIETVP